MVDDEGWKNVESVFKPCFARSSSPGDLSSGDSAEFFVKNFAGGLRKVFRADIFVEIKREIHSDK